MNIFLCCDVPFLLSFSSYVAVERNNKKAALHYTGTNRTTIRAVFCLMHSELLHKSGADTLYVYASLLLRGKYVYNTGACLERPMQDI